ncbi:PREDICTED: uncharacterized protein LOC105450070 [Wasmannia auropunctata]|uniref:uncharacterized protein LOC105450070 n=1 Tax=Wasmannia auropunctata TaxID=64793 RepID=UPI0005EEDE25|nr:PREDICTED: uncharacterized protein LOC105450070 [Wasmannia auropunctata]XP_011688007.1 PREDICTED: uncharacterized protein LOC105450070 [Wasmannia auropunctata]
MPNCMINLTWYLGKFIIGFTGILFLYVNFLKENETISCVCDTIRMRKLLGEKSEKMQGKRYSCGCNKPMRLTWNGDMVPAISNDFIKHKKSCCTKSRCCTRRNSC